MSTSDLDSELVCDDCRFILADDIETFSYKKDIRFCCCTKDSAYNDTGASANDILLITKLVKELNLRKSVKV